MNYCKASEEIFGTGSVVFYLDPSTLGIICAIDGDDNNKYYSMTGVRDGVLAYPNSLSFYDMWFTQAHSLPEIRGFIKLAKESKETFAPKDDELQVKFTEWLEKTICGRISADRQNLRVLGTNTNNLSKVLSFFYFSKYIDGETSIILNEEPLGKLKDVLVSNESPIFIPRTAQWTDDNHAMELIYRYKTYHDKAAGEELFEMYHKLIRSRVDKYAKLYGLPADYKEDILQNAFVKFLTNLTEYDPSKGKLTTYIYYLIDGMIRKELQRSNKNREREKTVLDRGAHEDDGGISPATVPQSREPNPSESLDKSAPEETNEIKQAIDSLPEVQKKIVNLYFYSGKTLQEIGDEIGLTRERIRQVLNNALEALKHRLTSVEALKIAMIFGD